MAKPYSNDLRRKFLQSYDHDQASLEELAEQYEVSVRLGQERYRPGAHELDRSTFSLNRLGPESRATDEVKQWLRAQVRQQADLNLKELQRGLVEEQKVQLSVSRLWRLLKRK